MMRLIFAIALLAMSGCTTTQVSEGSEWAAGELITVVLEAAFGGDDHKPWDYDSREYDPRAKTLCDIACEYRKEARIEAYVAEVQRRERRAESRAFQAEFDEFMRQLEEAERVSTESSQSIVAITSWQAP